MVLVDRAKGKEEVCSGVCVGHRDASDQSSHGPFMGGTVTAGQREEGDSRAV